MLSSCMHLVSLRFQGIALLFDEEYFWMNFHFSKISISQTICSFSSLAILCSEHWNKIYSRNQLRNTSTLQNVLFLNGIGTGRISTMLNLSWVESSLGLCHVKSLWIMPKGVVHIIIHYWLNITGRRWDKKRHNDKWQTFPGDITSHVCTKIIWGLKIIKPPFLSVASLFWKCTHTQIIIIDKHTLSH